MTRARIVASSLSRYLEEAKIEELYHTWVAKGYDVSRQVQFGDLTADFVATRGDETIIFEVKTANSLAPYRETVSRLARWAAENPNVSFHLIIANPPRQKSIEIAGLDDTLSYYLIHQEPPSELDELSTHTLIESIDDIEIQDIQIRPGEIRALGNGVVRVRLQYGSDSDLRKDIGAVAYEAFPFEFDLALDANLKPLEINRLEIDTSSFYE